MPTSLGTLDTLGERFAMDHRADPWAEEPDKRLWFSDGQVPEGAPGREHSTSGGVTQTDEASKSARR